MEVKYFNANDKQLAQTRIESNAEGGVLGGSFDSAIHKAASPSRRLHAGTL